LALVVGGLLALTVVVAARPIVVLLGGEDFAAAAPVLRIQAPVVLTIFLVYAWTTFLIADGRRRALVQCMLVGTSALFVAGITLIAQFDAEGAALAAVAADVVLAAVALRAVRHAGDGEIGIERGYLARYVATLAAGGGAALAVLAVAPAVIAAVAAAAVFTGVALALRIVPSEVTGLLPGR
jgi:O-antigen/teichoic acid export membrane protein